MNSIITDRTNSFAPGQHLENFLGFDLAIYLTNIKIIEVIPGIYTLTHANLFEYLIKKSRTPSGIDAKDLNGIQQLINRIEFPKIKVNTFIQYKRSRYLTNSNSSNWHYWQAPYYEFSIALHQQRLLENLSRNVGSKAKVLYCAPVFHTYSELWKNKYQDTLIKNSIFVEAISLNNHSDFTFTSPALGKALSDLENIEGYDFLNFLEVTEREESSIDFKENIKIIADVTFTAIKESKLFDEITTEVSSLLNKIESNFLKAIIKVNYFQYLTGVNWRFF